MEKRRRKREIDFNQLTDTQNSTYNNIKTISIIIMCDVDKHINAHIL